MQHLVVSLSAAAALVAIACKPPIRKIPPPANAPAELLAFTGAKLMIGAGDIASCTSSGDEQTATLVDSVLRADSVAKVEDVVFTLGDNAYPGGSASDFALCFTPSWGDSAKRIMKRIRPAPGNHEHLTGGGSPYYDYFGKSAGSPSKGYYSYALGPWHIIVLNSEIIINNSFTDVDRMAQDDWLQQDLKSNKSLCTLAYWHHPRFSSGWHGTDVRLQPLWQALYAGGVDVVLNGHDHDYERFQPLTPAGAVDSTKGITEMIAGTGGGELRGFNAPVPYSVYRLDGYFGVLKLTLGAEEYRSAFIDASGRVWDPHGGKCH